MPVDVERWTQRAPDLLRPAIGERRFLRTAAPAGAKPGVLGAGRASKRSARGRACGRRLGHDGLQ